mgnify:CR=1 FL=1
MATVLVQHRIDGARVRSLAHLRLDHCAVRQVNEGGLRPSSLPRITPSRDKSARWAKSAIYNTISIASNSLDSLTNALSKDKSVYWDKSAICIADYLDRHSNSGSTKAIRK